MAAHQSGARLATMLLGAASCASTPNAPEVKSPRASSSAQASAPESTDDAEAAALRSDRPPGTIYRSEIDRAFAGGPGYFLGQLAPEPYRVSGQFVGWKLTRMFPGDPNLCAPGCDIAVGDVILSVSGDRLETPTALSNMLARLPSLATLEVDSLRDAQRRRVTYHIVDDAPAVQAQVKPGTRSRRPRPPRRPQPLRER